MKNTIIALLAVLAFASCEKKQCYSCYVKSKPNSFNPQEPWKDGPSSTYCGWTDADAASWRKDNTRSGNQQFGYPSQTIGICQLK